MLSLGEFHQGGTENHTNWHDNPDQVLSYHSQRTLAAVQKANQNFPFGLNFLLEISSSESSSVMQILSATHILVL